MSLSNVFRDANIWKTFDNSKSSNGKIRQKVVFFFEEGTRIGRVVDVVCVYFNLKLSVFVDVEVVCACRPSSRLCLEESSVHSMYFSILRSSVCVVLATTLTLIFDIRPITRHLHTTSSFSSSLTYGLFFYIRLLLSRG